MSEWPKPKVSEARRRWAYGEEFFQVRSYVSSIIFHFNIVSILVHNAVWTTLQLLRTWRCSVLSLLRFECFCLLLPYVRKTAASLLREFMSCYEDFQFWFVRTVISHDGRRDHVCLTLFFSSGLRSAVLFCGIRLCQLGECTHDHVWCRAVSSLDRLGGDCNSYVEQWSCLGEL